MCFVSFSNDRLILYLQIKKRKRFRLPMSDKGVTSRKKAYRPWAVRRIITLYSFIYHFVENGTLNKNIYTS